MDVAVIVPTMTTVAVAAQAMTDAVHLLLQADVVIQTLIRLEVQTIF